MPGKKLPGLFFFVFMGMSFLMVLFYIGPAFSGTGLPASKEIIKGLWAPKFEKTLGEKLPVYTPSRNFWGEAEYELFHQGRKGVVIGEQGWLFTDEEFSCPRANKKILSDNLNFIASTRNQLKQQGTDLVVVLIPSKARVMSAHLGVTRISDCRQNLYGTAMRFLNKENIKTVNVLEVVKQNPENVFFKTDTHWTPKGAELAAKATSQLVLLESSTNFVTQAKGETKHKGDLLSYTPGVNENEIAEDTLAIYKTSMENNEPVSDAGLFNDNTPPVTLVGTSYSANPLWNFEGFLKQSLHNDILNAADEGQGPFTVMTKYLEGRAWKDHPPHIVIWEIPERYLISAP